MASSTAIHPPWRALRRASREKIGNALPHLPTPPMTPEGWWESAFSLVDPPSTRQGHPCGQDQMLTVIAYDITSPKRLQKVAKLCEDYGVRVQYSVFECRLHADRFDEFWLRLEDLIDPDEDRLVAYKICLNCAREILTSGRMVLSSQPVAYVF